MNLGDLIAEHSGPPVNIEAIIRELDIQLDKKADLDQEISGQIEKIGSGCYKISVNKSDHYYRQRFTMAHELGHFLYHFHLIGDGVDDNTAYRSAPEGRFFNKKILPSHETEANQFAASVLMPKDLVLSEWEKSQNLADVSKRFQVSQQAMQYRLQGLGVTVG